jgi:hypothetical protein
MSIVEPRDEGGVSLESPQRNYLPIGLVILCIRNQR